MAMKLRITIEDVPGQWDVELPDDHELVRYAARQRDLNGRYGFDAVTDFQLALTAAIREDLRVEVIP